MYCLVYCHTHMYSRLPFAVLLVYCLTHPYSRLTLKSTSLSNSSDRFWQRDLLRSQLQNGSTPSHSPRLDALVERHIRACRHGDKGRSTVNPQLSSVRFPKCRHQPVAYCVSAMYADPL
jgi:hypothetical protein